MIFFLSFFVGVALSCSQPVTRYEGPKTTSDKDVVLITHFFESNDKIEMTDFLLNLKTSALTMKAPGDKSNFYVDFSPVVLDQAPYSLTYAANTVTVVKTGVNIATITLGDANLVAKNAVGYFWVSEERKSIYVAYTDKDGARFAIHNYSTSKTVYRTRNVMFNPLVAPGPVVVYDLLGIARYSTGPCNNIFFARFGEEEVSVTEVGELVLDARLNAGLRLSVTQQGDKLDIYEQPFGVSGNVTWPAPKLKASAHVSSLEKNSTASSSSSPVIASTFAIVMGVITLGLFL